MNELGVLHRQFHSESLAMYFVFAVLFALQCASATIVLDCQYSMHFYQVLGKAYQCEPKVMRSGSTSNVEGVTQLHETGKCDQDVEALEFKEQPIDSVPKDINMYFANLKALNFFKCPIKSFTEDDLKPFPNLKILRIERGQLTAISGNVFMYSPELQYVDFEYNQITNIGPKIFEYTPQLASAYFKGNSCIDKSVEYDATAVAALSEELELKCPPTTEQECEKNKKLDLKHETCTCS